MIYEIDGKGIYLRTSWVVSIESSKDKPPKLIKPYKKPRP